jgi:hypothetical protein
MQYGNTVPNGHGVSVQFLSGLLFGRQIPGNRAQGQRQSLGYLPGLHAVFLRLLCRLFPALGFPLRPKPVLFSNTASNDASDIATIFLNPRLFACNTVCKYADNGASFGILLLISIIPRNCSPFNPRRSSFSQALPRRPPAVCSR